MGMHNDEEFGTTIAGSRWFNQTPKTRRVKVETYEEHWDCPMQGCKGEMRSNGNVWPMHPAGYHHTCSECGFTAAPYGGASFPRTFTEPKRSWFRKLWEKYFV